MVQSVVTYDCGILTPYEVKCLGVILRVFNKDINDELSLSVLLSKVSSLVVITTLTTHDNGRLEVKLEITRRFDKLFQLLHILQLGVAVQQQCGMVSGGFAVFVKLFQVLNEVVYALGIKEL
jgi:hypothetical protein